MIARIRGLPTQAVSNVGNHTVRSRSPHPTDASATLSRSTPDRVIGAMVQREGSPAGPTRSAGTQARGTDVGCQMRAVRIPALSTEQEGGLARVRQERVL